MITIELACGVAVVCILLIYKLFLHVVPAGRFGLVERFGVFKKVIGPGGHFLLWPLERLRRVQWTYPGQNGKLHVFSSSMPYSRNAQMDIPPLDCLTKDRIQVQVDTTLTYNVTNPERAVYHTDDPLNLLFQHAQQALTEIVSNLTADEIRQWKSVSGRVQSRINDYISEDGQDCGVSCTRFIIQHVSMDNKILKANEAIYTQQRQHKMQMEKEQAAFERTQAQAKRAAEARKHALEVKYEHDMLALTTREQREEKEHELELAKEQHAADVRLLQARSRAEEEKLKWTGKLGAGFTPDQVVQLETSLYQAEAQKAMAASGNTTYAPLDFWNKNWWPQASVRQQQQENVE